MRAIKYLLAGLSVAGVAFYLHAQTSKPAQIYVINDTEKPVYVGLYTYNKVDRRYLMQSYQKKKEGILQTYFRKSKIDVRKRHTLSGRYPGFLVVSSKTLKTKISREEFNKEFRFSHKEIARKNKQTMKVVQDKDGTLKVQK